MARSGWYRSTYGVYVFDERGVGHNRPHAHIRKRGTRVASIFLDTGVLLDVVERLPAGLHEEILVDVDVHLDTWESLNQ